jgi:hypothetical protein
MDYESFKLKLHSRFRIDSWTLHFDIVVDAENVVDADSVFEVDINQIHIAERGQNENIHSPIIILILSVFNHSPNATHMH